MNTSLSKFAFVQFCGHTFEDWQSYIQRLLVFHVVVSIDTCRDLGNGLNEGTVLQFLTV